MTTTTTTYHGSNSRISSWANLRRASERAASVYYTSPSPRRQPQQPSSITAPCVTSSHHPTHLHYLHRPQLAREPILYPSHSCTADTGAITRLRKLGRTNGNSFRECVEQKKKSTARRVKVLTRCRTDRFSTKNSAPADSSTCLRRSY